MPYSAIEKKLLTMREELLKKVSVNIRTESQALGPDIGDLYDQATSERDRELSLLLSDRDRRKLVEIDEALARIADKTYGTCESCGEKIAKGRLLALPFTRLCVTCKSEQEKQEAFEEKAEEEEPYKELPFTEEEEA